MIPRLYFAQPLHPEQRFNPGQDVCRYLLRTLRLPPGSPLILFNGEQPGEWQARLQDASGSIEVLNFTPNKRESPLAITLVQGISKTKAMELTIQKAVELGVHRIIPLLCRRSSSNAGSELTDNRQRRLHRIAIEAAEQCGRTSVPKILPPTNWSALGNHLCPGPRWFFWEEGEQAPRFTDLAHPGPSVSLLVGPEGGLEASEEQFAREQLGFITLNLGPRILHTATAAMTVITACQLLWGDMGGRGGA